MSKLPADVGDENGETVIDERKIRIKTLPNVKKAVAKPLQPSMDLPVSDVGLVRRLVDLSLSLSLSLSLGARLSIGRVRFEFVFLSITIVVSSPKVL